VISFTTRKSDNTHEITDGIFSSEIFNDGIIPSQNPSVLADEIILSANTGAIADGEKLFLKVATT
jgi:hypothetical protein